MTERGHWSVDLVAVGAATAACAAGIAAGIDGVARLLVAAPLVLFLPGYAVVAALFPERASSRHALRPFDEVEGSSLGATEVLKEGTGLGAGARVALSVLCSLATLPLVALGADLLGAGVRLDPVLAILVGTTGLALAFAAVARLRCDPADRFAVAVRLPRVWFRADRYRIRDAAIPNVLLVVGVVLLSASVGYAALSPPTDEGGGFTEFYVETEDMTIDTETLYPETFARGQQSTIDAYVGNREGSDTDYEVVAVLQRVERTGPDNGSVEVTERQRLATRDVAVAANTTERVTLTVTPGIAGEDLRLVLFLYRGETVPEVPARTTAYRTLRLNVTVT